jgi:multidrug efflux system membrane fusion protein
VVIEGVDRLRDGSKVDVAKKDGVAVAASPDAQAKPEGKFRKRDKR